MGYGLDDNCTVTQFDASRLALPERACHLPLGDWLESDLLAKFLKPVKDGDSETVQGKEGRFFPASTLEWRRACRRMARCKLLESLDLMLCARRRALVRLL
jgi:hypothetical protein